MTTKLEDKKQVILLVGTEKGLFRLISDEARQHWRMEGPLIAGYEVLHAWNDPRQPNRAYAAVKHTIWGPHLYCSDDYGRQWNSLSVTPQHAPGLHSQSLRAIWYLAPGPADAPDTLYAGIDPAVLFVSHDRCVSCTPISALIEYASSDELHV